MENPKFSRVTDKDFSKTLRRRVNQYFKDNNISKKGNANMVVKTIVMSSLFFGPLILLSTGFVTSTWLLFTCYIICGFGMSGIGMGVMHDALHGSYSKHRIVNKLLGYTFNLIGANAEIWKIQHNVLHHSYTNIDHADDDINTPFFLRFSPNGEHHKSQKFQHIYIWFFYAISTLFWITAKDFVRLKRYKDMGLLNKKNEYEKGLVEMTAWKLFYYSYALILPLIMVPLPWYIIALGFLCMHLVTGLMVSIVFQIAHIMPETDFPLPDEDGMMKNEWYRHQLATTSNFAPNSKLLFWLIGGLNYQVEHHVLPDVCHVHYKNLTGIVKQTAHEFNMPYHVKKSMFHAIKDHTKMLKLLGNNQTVSVT
ncbi:fatty acid desaturase family protein [Bizionia arctica]|uniref:Fatty acid desaturase n=1 Tax=Bizionia arctica TaxID=1495645 RepID=A0A917LPC6_9FLAO|nr:acyl-CoA desaturase [Bizionia arctica]GGG47822.1 fatty acid desaturase [Bizionia arctica]